MLASSNPQADNKGALVVKKELEVQGVFTRGAVKTITAGATPTLDCARGNIFTVTPAEAENITAVNLVVGQEIILIVLTSGTSTYTITFGTGFLSTGTLATGTSDAKRFVVRFISDGTRLMETSRTTAM